MGDPPKAFIMSTKGTVTIRPRKMITNMIAEYLSKAKGHKASSEATVIFGMKSKFGGSRSSCFALVYDSTDAAKKFEPKHRLIRSGFETRPDAIVGRKQRKEKKNREKKFRGTRKEKRVRPGK